MEVVISMVEARESAPDLIRNLEVVRYDYLDDFMII
jgi:hypothetical protein